MLPPCLRRRAIQQEPCPDGERNDESYIEDDLENQRRQEEAGGSGANEALHVAGDLGHHLFAIRQVVVATHPERILQGYRSSIRHGREVGRRRGGEGEARSDGIYAHQLRALEKVVRGSSKGKEVGTSTI